ncbi:indole-3-acetic acid inducible 33 [Perilla frutescens var. hirtella]|nr:indole-3-acetic acid inducible 33 [Perilla frutescens var. hirtella]KAH6817514.1 indole-3-acetic acid inducible 33 [Perilla frutescens var. frutescens]
MWEERRSATGIDESFKHYKLAANVAPTLVPPFTSSNPKKRSFSGGFDDDLVAAVVPPVTVVLEGRSICQRISLHKHSSYQSFARALRQMFVDQNSSNSDDDVDTNLDLSNAVPGHLIAYEDMENDLLLVGDLNWKDFVRVAKRIRILPAKAKSRKLAAD